MTIAPWLLEFCIPLSKAAMGHKKGHVLLAIETFGDSDAVPARQWATTSGLEMKTSLAIVNCCRDDLRTGALAAFARVKEIRSEGSPRFKSSSWKQRKRNLHVV